ncbi:hypothetical protein D9756_001529 [Leucocoprinus leucothites]|uniref:Uncharacterized protein n=1 Tax=Leucocoprinus leucothites TaxID=201217 RepID=A0A8H5G4R7_9AGAR|nr:hypothetical protein D9756_001529 [Leucoagaricus leucothites]
MLFLPRPPLLRRTCARFLHVSARRGHLVAPPDPISHMRPIIYEDTPIDPSKPSPPSLLRHPYSLSEFSNTRGNDQASNLELQFGLQRQQLDAFHHNFWLDSNSRFEAAKHAILSSLPESSTALDKENALSEFHKQWVMQEKERTDAYTAEWRRRNWTLILLETRVRYQRFTSRIGRLFSSPKNTRPETFDKHCDGWLQVKTWFSTIDPVISALFPLPFIPYMPTSPLQ